MYFLFPMEFRLSPYVIVVLLCLWVVLWLVSELFVPQSVDDSSSLLSKIGKFKDARERQLSGKQQQKMARLKQSHQCALTRNEFKDRGVRWMNRKFARV